MSYMTKPTPIESMLNILYHAEGFLQHIKDFFLETGQMYESRMLTANWLKQGIKQLKTEFWTLLESYETDAYLISESPLFPTFRYDLHKIISSFEKFFKILEYNKKLIEKTYLDLDEQTQQKQQEKFEIAYKTLRKFITNKIENLESWQKT